MEFSELKLHPDLQKGINEAGYTTCMPVQEQVLRNAFGGQDMYVQSQTGTGKTAAFLIVIFQRLLTETLLKGKKAIIMVPTRELAVQVEEEAKTLGKYLPIKTGSFYGGVGYTNQTKMLRENVQVLVGTPGRVLDLNKSGQMNLMEIAFLVIDEADRMFDMGFYPDLRRLIKVVPPADRRQTMLFSATLNSWVKNLAWEYTKSPFEIEIAPELVTVEEVQQVLYHVSSESKMKLLLGILKHEQPESVLVFCNTKRYTEITAKRLRMNGIQAEFIIGDLPQPKRLKVIENIKAGKLRCLVATDVAARGLDIEDLALVVNYDLPNETENYIHRIGRTARAGKTGKAITLASEQDVYQLPAIERYIGKKIPVEHAGDDLYAEDLSERTRIRTEFAAEKSSGPAGRKAVKPERRDRTARSTKPERASGPERGAPERAKPERSPQVRSKPAKTGTERRKETRKPADAGTAKRQIKNRPDTDLAKLSLEERMAYYKEKYSNEPDAPKVISPVKKTANKSGKPVDENRELPAEKKPESPRKNLAARLLGFFRKKN